MKRIALQTQIYADIFLGFSSSGGVAEGRGGFPTNQLEPINISTY